MTYSNLEPLTTIALLFACALAGCTTAPSPLTSVPIEVIPATDYLQTTPNSTVSKLVLTPTGTKNHYGNPIYSLTVIGKGSVVAIFPVVTGRAHTQTRDRHVAGTEAPLPNGSYRVSNNPRPSSEYEVGGMFLDITPLFPTGRSALGFHVDPSYNKSKKEDGTAGCIGTTTTVDRNALYRLVSLYKIKLLEVNI